MKKLITIIFCLFISITINAQEHLEFMGVPTKGSIYEIKKQLEEKGFEYVRTTTSGYSTYTLMQGMFCGELCDIVMGLDNDYNVYHFQVKTHHHHRLSEETALNMYNIFKKSYKYKKKRHPEFLGKKRETEVSCTLVNNEEKIIGTITFSYSEGQVLIDYSNAPKKPKVLPISDKHCCDKYCKF
jgi:hypothetical protein